MLVVCSEVRCLLGPQHPYRTCSHCSFSKQHITHCMPVLLSCTYMMSRDVAIDAFISFPTTNCFHTICRPAVHIEPVSLIKLDDTVLPGPSYPGSSWAEPSRPQQQETERIGSSCRHSFGMQQPRALSIMLNAPGEMHNQAAFWAQQVTTILLNTVHKM